jgi:hypothetical protein
MHAPPKPSPRWVLLSRVLRGVLLGEVVGSLVIAAVLLLWVPLVALAALCLALAPPRCARGLRWPALAVGVLGLTVGAPLAAWEIQHRLDDMAERLAANGWRLSTSERVRVATLNLAMGLGGHALGYGCSCPGLGCASGGATSPWNPRSSARTSASCCRRPGATEEPRSR